MNWLLLIYKIPREPTAGRVYVWRKLKQLGAISVQDAVWVLPATPKTQEQFQWLAAEVMELGGEVSLFTSQLVFGSEPKALQEQFEAPLRTGYAEILKALKRRKPDLAASSPSAISNSRRRIIFNVNWAMRFARDCSPHKEARDEVGDLGTRRGRPNRLCVADSKVY